MSKKKKYTQVEPGTVFLVPPLAGNRDCIVGVAARTNADGLVLGYFFGPYPEETVQAIGFSELSPKSAFYYCFFGDLGIQKGEWKSLGCISSFSELSWPLPRIFRIDPDGTEAVEVFIDNQLFTVAEKPCSVQLARTGCQEDVHGYVAAQRLLFRIAAVAE